MESTEVKPQTEIEQHPERAAFKKLSKVANELIIGQERLMERLVMALLCNGNKENRDSYNRF